MYLMAYNEHQHESGKLKLMKLGLLLHYFKDKIILC